MKNFKIFLVSLFIILLTPIVSRDTGVIDDSTSYIYYSVDMSSSAYTKKIGDKYVVVKDNIPGKKYDYIKELSYMPNSTITIYIARLDDKEFIVFGDFEMDRYDFVNSYKFENSRDFIYEAGNIGNPSVIIRDGKVVIEQSDDTTYGTFLVKGNKKYTPLQEILEYRVSKDGKDVYFTGVSGNKKVSIYKNDELLAGGYDDIRDINIDGDSIYYIAQSSNMTRLYKDKDAISMTYMNIFSYTINSGNIYYLILDRKDNQMLEYTLITQDLETLESTKKPIELDIVSIPPKLFKADKIYLVVYGDGDISIGTIDMDSFETFDSMSDIQIDGGSYYFLAQKDGSIYAIVNGKKHTINFTNALNPKLDSKGNFYYIGISGNKYYLVKNNKDIIDVFNNFEIVDYQVSQDGKNYSYNISSNTRNLYIGNISSTLKVELNTSYYKDINKKDDTEILEDISDITPIDTISEDTTDDVLDIYTLRDSAKLYLQENGYKKAIPKIDILPSVLSNKTKNKVYNQILGYKSKKEIKNKDLLEVLNYMQRVFYIDIYID